MNEKTICARLFNGLFKEQSAKFVYRILLCSFLFLSGTITVCAQSNDTVQIVFEKVPVDDELDNKGLPKRDLELEAILPAAMYDVSNDNLVFISRYVTFESVTYYIMEANSIVVEVDEIVLPKNVEITLPIAQLPSGSYRILLETDGVYFQGWFVK